MYGCVHFNVGDTVVYTLWLCTLMGYGCVHFNVGDTVVYTLM